MYISDTWAKTFEYALFLLTLQSTAKLISFRPLKNKHLDGDLNIAHQLELFGPQKIKFYSEFKKCHFENFSENEN